MKQFQFVLIGILGACAEPSAGELRGVVYSVGEDGAARYAADAHVAIVGDTAFAPVDCAAVDSAARPRTAYDALARIDSATVATTRTNATGRFVFARDSVPRAGWLFVHATSGGTFWARLYTEATPDSLALGEDDRRTGSSKLCSVG